MTHNTFWQRFCRVFSVVIFSAGSHLSVAAEFVPPAEEADEFHFVVLGDAQFHDTHQFNRLIDQARRLRPAFVIQVGDLIEGYNSDLDAIAAEWQRFANQIAPLAPVPFLAVPGNHDVYGGNKTVDPQLEAIFEETWGPLYYAFTYKNTLLVTLNSDSSEGANRITGEQLTWLRRTLDNSTAQHKLVFMHRPPMLLANAQALHQVFKQRQVSHVFYGHHHHYHFFEQDGIAYTMTNAAATSAHDHESVGGFHHLLQVSVRGDEVAVAVIEADAIKAQDVVRPQDNYDFFALTRKLAPKRVKLKPLKQPNQFTLRIPLANTTERDLTLLVSCQSADERWQFEPQTIAPIELAQGAKQTLSVRASFSDHRIPESKPTCTVRVPFQTARGEWLDFESRVTGTY